MLNNKKIYTEERYVESLDEAINFIWSRRVSADSDVDVDVDVCLRIPLDDYPNNIIHDLVKDAQEKGVTIASNL